MAHSYVLAQRIIVIHPGSLYLRMGRASDLNPITILHAVARKRRKSDNAHGHKDSLLPQLETTQESITEFEDIRLQVLQSQVSNHEERSSKRPRITLPLQQIVSFNKRSVPKQISPDEGEENGRSESSEELTTREVLFDQDILRLSAKEAALYNIHFPIRRGEIHLHNGIGGTLEAVLSHLQTIWGHVIHDILHIKQESLVQYGAVLVIPDVYNRSHLREFTTLILQRLGFRSCFLVQDHVSATFGAGLSYACVVDIGDQKCSVSCVEDGICNPESRVRLTYGGGDVTQVFNTLLRLLSFPYIECDVERNLSDAVLLMHLKERLCHLTLNVCGAQEHNFEVKRLNKQLHYTFQIGDECFLAPLSFFYTELFNITGKNKQAFIQLPSCQQQDPEDCFDAEYIRETGRKNGGRDQLLEGSLPVTGEVAEEELVVDDVAERDINAKSREKANLLYMPNDQIVPLDQAIVRSIEHCSTEEIKRKMYSCILLVGGSSKFVGLSELLEKRLSTLLATANTAPSFEVNIYTKEMDAGMIAWKGAAIMSCLESAPELWIHLSEWEKYGLRVLREKAPFIW